MRKCMKYGNRCYPRITLYILAIKSVIQCAESEFRLSQFLKALLLCRQLLIYQPEVDYFTRNLTMQDNAR